VSLSAHDPLRHGDTPEPRPTDGPTPGSDSVLVTCGACGHRQNASGRAPGYTCQTCGSVWRVLRCRDCRHASVVLDGVTDCPQCGRSHRPRTEPAPALPSWVLDPAPLSIWLGGARYLGGHAERDQPISAAGLLLDRRGIHVRAFADLFTIPWATVSRVDIEGPLDISDRISMPKLVALGASTWATTVSYLTVHTPRGDAIFEIDGLSSPELRARLSRVLQGLETPPRTEPIALERGTPVAAPAATPADIPPVSALTPPPMPAPPERREPEWGELDRDEPTPLGIEPATSDAPLEVLVVDALWKLAQLRDGGMLGPAEVSVLRSRLLARLAQPGTTGGDDGGPLLRV
jgi:hypothetical protein